MCAVEWAQRAIRPFAPRTVRARPRTRHPAPRAGRGPVAGGPPPQKSPIPSRHTRCIPLTADVSVVFGNNSQLFPYVERSWPCPVLLTMAPECREVPCVGCSAIGVSVGDSQHDSLSVSPSLSRLTSRRIFRIERRRIGPVITHLFTVLDVSDGNCRQNSKDSLVGNPLFDAHAILDRGQRHFRV